MSAGDAAQRFYIEDPETKARYKVTQDVFERLYQSRGFVKVGTTRAEAAQYAAKRESENAPEAEAHAEAEPFVTEAIDEAADTEDLAGAEWHDGLTVADLRQRAKDLGVPGYSSMVRDRLIAEIEDAERDN